MEFLKHFIIGVESVCHSLQQLFVQQFHTKFFGQGCTHLMSTGTELSVDGDNEFFVDIHSKMCFCGYRLQQI